MHRDIKSDNILINNGIYKIADFGLSEIKNNILDKKFDSIGNKIFIKGTPLYMCP